MDALAPHVLVPLGVQGVVGSGEEVLDRVACCELGEADRHRPWFEPGRESDAHLLEPRRHIGVGHAGDCAHELVASVPDDQVVGPQLGPQCVRDLDEQPVTGSMAACVVGALEAVDVDEGGDEGLIGAPRSVDVAMQLHQPGVAQVDTREAVERCPLAIDGGRTAVATRPRSLARSRGAVSRRGVAVRFGLRPFDASCNPVRLRKVPVDVGRGALDCVRQSILGGLAPVRRRGAPGDRCAQGRAGRRPVSFRSLGVVVPVRRGVVSLPPGDISSTTGVVTFSSGDVALIAIEVTSAAGDVTRIPGQVAAIGGDIASSSHEVALVAGAVASITGDIAVVPGNATRR